jgi:hypothetical protein
MAHQSAEIWRDLFLNWPEALPRRGLVVSSLNEPIPFKGFLIKGEMLLLERTNPDPIGTRFIAISYDAIHLLKIIDPLTESVLNAAGFKGQLAKV